MKRFLPFLLCIPFTGCFVQQPVKEEITKNNQDYTVDYLFEHEGCKVYRFYDRGKYVYFTNCSGEAIAKTDSTTVTNSTGPKTVGRAMPFRARL